MVFNPLKRISFRFNHNPVIEIVLSCWALLIGMAMVMVGNGLQISLLGLRATVEGFSPAVIGLIMSGYFCGFITGSKITPILIAQVGYVRVFAAFASIVSTIALLHGLFINPTGWLFMRLVTGFCFAGLFIVTESWLNSRVANRNRGQLLSIYMVITLGGMGIGPLFINLAMPSEIELFVLISILFSLSLVPMLLTVEKVPRSKAPVRMNFKELIAETPVGIVGCVVAGLSNGAILSVGTVYAGKSGMTISEISLFMTMAIWGGVAFQWPLGYLSDKFDRRHVIALVTFSAAGIAVACLLISRVSLPGLLLLMVFMGGFSFPLYSLSLSSANDRLLPEQLIAAGSSLIMANGIGAVFGSIISGTAISAFGPLSYFIFLAMVHFLFGFYMLYRVRIIPSAPLEKQSPSIYIGRTSQIIATSALERETDNEGIN